MQGTIGPQGDLLAVPEPQQSAPALVITSAAVDLLNPTELKATVTAALACHVAGGEWHVAAACNSTPLGIALPTERCQQN